MNKTLILYAAVAALVVAALLVIFATPAPEPARPASAKGVANTAPSKSGLDGSASGASPVSRPVPARQSTGGAVSAMAPAMSEEKQQQLLEINEAMTTYSKEGLPILTPYLSSPDAQIRAATIEAVVQLAVPEGAEVLRNAANTAKTPQERVKLLEGAEFLELPRLPVEELRKMINDGSIKLNGIAPQTGGGQAAPRQP